MPGDEGRGEGLTTTGELFGVMEMLYIMTWYRCLDDIDT